MPQQQKRKRSELEVIPPLTPTVPLRPRKAHLSTTSLPPSQNVPQLPNINEIPQTHHIVSDSDSDSAPETISLAASAVKSRLKNAEVAKAAKGLAVEHKRKRKERDERLKQQATPSIKKKKLQEVDVRPSHTLVIDEDKKGYQPPQDIRDEGVLLSNPVQLPKFLPQSLLDALPSERKATPEMDMRLDKSAIVRNNHDYNHIIKLPSANKPKDLTIGPLSVSVLEKINKVLPPKVVSKSKGIQNNWLRGRTTMASLTRGHTKATLSKGVRMERKPWGSAKAFHS
jgi:hypothetical protein